MDTQEEQGAFILIGGYDRDTRLAREMLDNAGVRYRFAFGEATGGAWPQLVSGLMSFVGLEQISRVASRAGNRVGPPS